MDRERLPDQVPAVAGSQARIRVSASIAARHVNFAGLRYGSEQFAEALEEAALERDQTVVVCVDPNDLSEVEAHIAGLAFPLQALDQGLAAVTSLVVQLCLFDPPSFKRIGPATARAGSPDAKKPKPVERPWLPTLGILER